MRIRLSNAAIERLIVAAYVAVWVLYAIAVSGCGTITPEMIEEAIATWESLDATPPSPPPEVKPPAPEATPQPPPTPPAVVVSTNYDVILTVKRITSNSVWMDWTPRPLKWNEDRCAGCCALYEMFVWKDGEWTGPGKFDWVRMGGQPVKEFKNIVEGYNGWTVPKSGERVAFRWRKSDGSKQSNLAEAIWP